MKTDNSNVSNERVGTDTNVNKGRNKNSSNKGHNRNKNRGGNESGKNCNGKRNFTNGDINNPTYYYEDANVLQQVMNFSFNEFGGVPIEFNRDQYGNKVNLKNTMIASYWLNPSLPQTSSTDPVKMDGVTTSALRNYLALSGSNAKTTNYAPQDVTLLLLGIAEVIKASTWLARAFGVAYLFNYRNRTYPETLLLAMGIQPDDFSRNLAAYRVRYNKLLALASKIPFPADIPVFRKAADLYAYIYVDDPNSALAQTYLLNPSSVWMFKEDYDENGAGLESSKFCNTLATETFGDILDRFETMISLLLNSTSLNAIYSDVMRLVQNGKISNLITFKSIPDMFVTTPVYNEEIRDWLHNAIIMGYPITDGYYNPTYMEPLTKGNDVCCDANTNKVLYHPQFLIDMSWGFNEIIDFTHDNPSLEEKVRATRLSQRYTIIADGNTGYTNNLAFSDEYIVSVDFWSDTEGPDLILNSNHESYTSATPRHIVSVDDSLSKFDWAPLFYWADADNGIWHIQGDLDYYTTLDFNTLKKIYDYEVIHFLQIG